MYGSWDMVHNGRTDGQMGGWTDRWKKWHIELGAPPKKEIKNLKINVKATEDDPLNTDEVSAKLIKLEDRSRRNNLWIDSIKKESNETWEACKNNWE